MEDYYISHHALVEAVNGVSTHWLNDWSTMGVLAMIDRQQAADVAPVVHGKWTEDGACPYCGCYVPTDDAHDAIFKSEVHYCYYCGAKMDGD